MKVTLDNKEYELEISDDEFDMPGWVTITIEGKHAEIHIKDLMPALIAFDAKYSRDLEDNKRS